LQHAGAHDHGGSGENEDFAEINKKALKYSLIAGTNILIKSNPELILNKRVNLI
jgi:hypothetical protein